MLGRKSRVQIKIFAPQSKKNSFELRTLINVSEGLLLGNFWPYKVFINTSENEDKRVDLLAKHVKANYLDFIPNDSCLFCVYFLHSCVGDLEDSSLTCTSRKPSSLQ